MSYDRLHASPGPLPRARLAAHAAEAAPALIGALLVRDEPDGSITIARVVETEAYREDDPASHSHAKRTSRAEPMFAGPGTAYVYRSYGVHWCCNVSVEAADVGSAVLLRAAAVVAGEATVRTRRPRISARRDLLRGPGNLTRGLAVDGPSHDGHDLVSGADGLALATDGWWPEPARVRDGPRVGVSLAAELAWRWRLDGAGEVSRYVRSPRAP